MAPIGAFLSASLARFLGASGSGRMKVLDIAAGHGLYGIALLRENPQAEVHLDPAACERLLKKVHEALVPGGRAVVLGLIPNEDRVSPPTAAAFNLVMLATTGGGDCYPISELDRMFRNAGFDHTELHELPPSPEHVVIAHR